MTESIYNQYSNKYYNPTDNDKKPGDNDNWKSLQKGFYQIGHTQVETTEGLTLGKGDETETSISDAQLANVKDGKFDTLTLGTGTAGETSLSAAQLANVKGGEFTSLTLGKGTDNEESLTAEELTAMKNVNGIPSVNLVSADLTGIISLSQTIPANKIGSVIGSKQVTGLTPNSKYAILGIYVSGGQTGAHIVGGIHSMNTFTTDATGKGTLTFTILVSNDTNADISVSSTLSGGYSISIMEYK